MDLQELAFDVSRRYIQDQEGQIDTALFNLALGGVRSRDIRLLSSLSTRYQYAYQSIENCRFCRQVAAFFSKNAAFADPLITYLSAQSAFEKAERVCKRANKRLDHFEARHPDRRPDDIALMVERTKRIIADVLGDSSSFFQVIPEIVKVTSGATSTTGRRDSLPFMKMKVRNVAASVGCQPLYRTLLNHFGFEKVTFTDCPYNRVETVPKNWKTDRTIACEPEGNLPFQLAFDHYVKGRLRIHGVDLSDQTRNQDLARAASVDGQLATIDFAQASDTISLNAVHALIPQPWVQYLMAIRSHKGIGFGQEFVYEKFSSMGNGCTFALETLIFWAIAKAVCGRKSNVSAYGDDIIIPTDKTEAYISAVAYFGFSINIEKSFTSGPFRESCGVDAFNGIDVTPFYLRSKSFGKPELCHVVNGVAAIALPDGKLESFLARLVQESKLPLVPFSDNSMIGVWIDIYTARRIKVITSRHNIERVRCYVAKDRTRDVFDHRCYWLWHLRARARRGEIKPEIPDNLIRTYTKKLEGNSMSVIKTSKVTTLNAKYKRTWVAWHPPSEVTPVHLFRWTDQLARVC